MTVISRNNRFTQHELQVDETIFSIANGYIGTRGTFAEGYGKDGQYHQTYLNGVYDYYNYHYEENLTGFPQRGQKFVNLLDGTLIEISIASTPLNMAHMQLHALERNYDLNKGYTFRKAHYKWGDYDFIITEKRLVSTKDKFVISIDLMVESPNYDGVITVKSYLKESQKALAESLDPRLHHSTSSQLRITDIIPQAGIVLSQTVHSSLHIASSVVHTREIEMIQIGDQLIGMDTFHLTHDTPYQLTKHIIHTSDLYDPAYIEQNQTLIHYFSEISFAELSKTEEEYSTLFWDGSGVSLPDNPEQELLLRYNIYQLNRQGGEHPVHNISAKGLSGEGYEGHYFWDTEIYMIPYFTLTNPNKAKQLLLYRYHTMEDARQEAHNLGYTKGIKIPWRTINGQETSPYYPAGSAQFHINSDVAYAVIKYVEATGDQSFLQEYGYELLIETARFLHEAVHYYNGTYHLYGVTGPDEYTTVVDDNFYTNIMLQYHFQKIVDWYHQDKEKLSQVIQKLHITEEEITAFGDVAENMYIPYDHTLGIHLQDQQFLSKPRLDLSLIPKDKFPLLLHFHPLYLYKHQVLKQADTILAYMLLDEFDQDIIERTFDYYDQITTHDSSLSKCIYSIIAFQLGKNELGSSYFQRVLETDINNIHQNTKDGLHVANLGGSYLVFAYGLVGLRIHQDHIRLFPRVTNDIKRYSIRFAYRNHPVTVTVDDHVTITTSGPVLLEIYGQQYTVDGTHQVPLLSQHN